MSGNVRTGIVFGVAAVAAFVAGIVFPFPIFNFVLAFGSMLALGWGAGYTAAKTAQPGTGRGIGRGTVAGLIAGGIVLVLSTLFAGLLTTFARWQSLPLIADLVGGTGGGFCIGLISLGLLAAGGAVGGVSWRGVPSIANTGEGAYGTGTVGQDDPHVRVYDQPDR